MKQKQTTTKHFYKKKSSISTLPTPSLLPTPHSSAIQEEPQRFFLLFIIPSIRAGNYHTGWRAVLTTQHGIAWGGVSVQTTLASKTSQAKTWQIRALLSPKNAPPPQYKSLPGMTTRIFPEPHSFASSSAQL